MPRGPFADRRRTARQTRFSDRRGHPSALFRRRRVYGCARSDVTVRRRRRNRVLRTTTTGPRRDGCKASPETTRFKRNTTVGVGWFFRIHMGRDERVSSPNRMELPAPSTLLRFSSGHTYLIPRQIWIIWPRGENNARGGGLAPAADLRASLCDRILRRCCV